MDKAKSKSKSMEEISKIPSTNNNNDELARAHTARLSLPSQSHGKKRIHPVLPEVGTIDEEDDDSFRIQMGRETDESRQNTRGSQLSKKSHRSRAGSASSKSERARKVSSSSNRHKRDYGAYDNRAYDSNLDGISVISRTSTRASSSIQSLEVHREQYCCFAKWSPFERKLAALVAILITIILILVITIVILATTTNQS